MTYREYDSGETGRDVSQSDQRPLNDGFPKSESVDIAQDREMGHGQVPLNKMDLRVAQVEQLFAQAHSALYGALISIFLMTAVFWNAAPRWLLIPWTVCITLLYVGRHAMVTVFRKRSPLGQAAIRWGNWFAVGSTVAGLFWGAASVLLFPTQSVLHQAVLVMLIGGLSSGTVIVYSPLTKAYLPSVLAGGLPLAVMFFYQGTSIHAVVGGITLVYLAVLVVTGNRMHTTTTAYLGLRFEKDHFIKELDQRRAEAERLAEERRIDVLERKEAEAALEKARAELETRVQERTAELERANESLKKENQRFESLARNAPFGMVLIDEKGNFEYLNPKFKELFGYDLSDVPNGKEWFRRAYPDPAYREEVISAWKKDRERANQGETRPRTFTVRCKDGTEKIIHFRPAKLDTGQDLMTFEDITELEASEHALRENERFLSEMFQSIRDGISVLDRDLNIIQVNPKMEQWHRHKMPIVGRKCYEVYWNADAPCQACPSLLCLKSGKKESVIRSRPQPDGEFSISIELHSFPMRDESTGQIKGVIEYVRDITKAQRAETALKESEERYRTLVETMNEGLILEDENGSQIYVNHKMSEMLGYSKDEMAGRSYLEFVDSSQRELVTQESSKRKMGESSIYETILCAKDGRKIPVIVSACPLRDEEGKFKGNIAVFTDITDRKHAERVLEESETRYKQLAEGSLTGIFINQDGIAVYVNMRLAEMLGYTPEEMLGQPFLGAIHRDDHEMVMEMTTARLMGKEVPFQYELKLLTRDRETVYAEVHASVINYRGRPAVMGNLVDITDRKRAEQALRESEEKLRLVADNIQEVFWISTPGLEETVYVSPAYEKVWGRTIESRYSEPKSFLKAIHPGDRERVLEGIEGHSEGKWDFEFEYRIVQPDGTVRWIEDKGYPILDEEGKVRLMTGIAVDVTDRKDLEEQLRQAQKMEAVGTLAGGIAHDFNNLLQIISGHAELLEMELDKRGIKSPEMDAIRQSSDRGAALVKQLLTFSRRVESKFEPINLNDEVRDTERLLYRTIPKMIEIELRLEEGLKPVRADSTQIEQMLINLAVNAQEAMPDGGKLIIETQNVNLNEHQFTSNAKLTPGDYVLLKVSDTGRGIKEEVLNHIYEPFFTAKGLANRTGLGLSTVFGIVQMHGGHIACESDVGRGTTFTIYFPAMDSSIPKVEKEQGVSTVAGGTETILVVDDEPLIADLAKRILENAGYSIITAGSGKEAVEVYSQRGSDIDLVILDLIMPEMGGKQCLEKLLRIDPKVKALIASGFGIEGETKAILDIKAIGTVSKPVNVGELLRSVRQAIDGS